MDINVNWRCRTCLLRWIQSPWSDLLQMSALSPSCTCSKCVCHVMMVIQRTKTSCKCSQGICLPSSLRQHSTDGYIAVILPKFEESKSITENLLSREDFEKVVSKRAAEQSQPTWWRRAPLLVVNDFLLGAASAPSHLKPFGRRQGFFYFIILNRLFHDVPTLTRASRSEHCFSVVIFFLF